MSILIEDSPRNLLAWAQEAVQMGIARGAVITPFATPWINKSGPGGRRGANEVASGLRATGSEVWFDATTHALQMAGVGDFRYYDEYDLWSGTKNDLSTRELRESHVRAVFEIQDQLGAPRLGPTVLLHYGESATSQLALELAEAAVDIDPKCWLSIAGTAPFWASGSALDSHIGGLAQLDPRGWFLTVARPILALPVEAEAEEVHGLCRTTRALSEHCPVHISHGDLASLPAVAAGAYSVGSGWDQRQRVCAYGSFAARDPGGSGGGWYERPTLVGLLGSLKTGEAAVLSQRNTALATRLGPLPPPGPKEAFLHHITALSDATSSISSTPAYEQRYRALAAMYAAASSEWPGVQTITGSALGAADWVQTLANGLELYGRAEGW